MMLDDCITNYDDPANANQNVLRFVFGKFQWVGHVGWTTSCMLRLVELMAGQWTCKHNVDMHS